MSKTSAGWCLALALAGLVSSACGTQTADADTTGERKLAQPTPQIIAEGHKFLAKKLDAPIGSEHPLLIDGKRYIARIEKRDDPVAEPGRPPGEHKSVTVYEE